MEMGKRQKDLYDLADQYEAEQRSKANQKEHAIWYFVTYRARTEGDAYFNEKYLEWYHMQKKIAQNIQQGKVM